MGFYATNSSRHITDYRCINQNRSPPYCMFTNMSKQLHCPSSGIAFVGHHPDCSIFHLAIFFLSFLCKILSYKESKLVLKTRENKVSCIKNLLFPPTHHLCVCAYPVVQNNNLFVRIKCEFFQD